MDTPGYCECGCGQKTEVATRNSKRDGLQKGQPKRFVHGHNSYKPEPLYIEENRDFRSLCWIWKRAFNTWGRAQITVNGKVYLAHRYLYEQRYGPVEEGLHLHHLCEQPDCVRPAHLKALTPKEHHRLRKTTKLTLDKVKEMRSLYKEGGHSYKTLGEKFGVATSTAQSAINGKNWS